VERLLYEEAGEVAGKLHTGRSRNDQAVTDLRLWTMEAVDLIDQDVAALGLALASHAARRMDVILPGYTHGQRAQPMRWTHLLLAHAWPLMRDRERLAEARRRTAVLPLGSGALAGSGFPVDREFLRERLGFDSVSPNALDATGDRDFVADTLFALALIAVHVSRLGGELVTLASAEFGFVRLADEFSTGSSLMPQKRNPDVFELARAKSARVIGDLGALLGLVRGLSAGYQKDLQEDKSLLFDAVETVRITLPAVTGAVETLELVPDRMAAALDAGLLATDLADLLVAQGVPFRESHELVGRLVREGEKLGADLRSVPAENAAAIHPALPAALAALGDWETSVERRTTPGGSSRASLEVQLADLQRGFSRSSLVDSR
jgi:argininosuccinate lyase